MIKMECVSCHEWVTRVENLQMTCEKCTPPSPKWAVGADKVRFVTFDGFVDLWREVMADTCERWHDKRDDYTGLHGHNQPKRPVDCFCWDFDALLLMTNDELAERGLGDNYYRLFQQVMNGALRRHHKIETDKELFRFLSFGARYNNKRLELTNLTPRRRKAVQTKTDVTSKSQRQKRLVSAS